MSVIRTYLIPPPNPHLNPYGNHCVLRSMYVGDVIAPGGLSVALKRRWSDPHESVISTCTEAVRQRRQVPLEITGWRWTERAPLPGIYGAILKSILTRHAIFCMMSGFGLPIIWPEPLVTCTYAFWEYILLDTSYTVSNQGRDFGFSRRKCTVRVFERVHLFPETIVRVLGGKEMVNT